MRISDWSSDVCSSDLIGCHGLVLPMERSTSSYTHMGGEGANWIGLSRYSTSDHVFQNLGDGTYFHSGSLAIRAAIAAGVNITYKILFNDVVAMTGGQAMDGALTRAEERSEGKEGVSRCRPGGWGDSKK